MLWSAVAGTRFKPKMWENTGTEPLDRNTSSEENHKPVIFHSLSPPGLWRGQQSFPTGSSGVGGIVATKARDVGVERSGLSFKRHFTREGVHPFDEVTWQIRDAVIPNYKEGGNAFEQRGVEFPSTWSQNATNIVAQKYFRGQLGTSERESSVRQMIGRVVDTITRWGTSDRYFASDTDARVFAAELTHLLV